MDKRTKENLAAIFFAGLILAGLLAFGCDSPIGIGVEFR